MLDYMYAEIIAERNFQSAYLELSAKLCEDNKAGRYHGLDNLTLGDHDADSRELLAQARQELIELVPIEPAIRLAIPKKSDLTQSREIFIYSIKERIKAQAISRIVAPVFEKHFSERLFSYRPGKPPYLAAHQFARRYRRGWDRDYILTVDLHNYSSFIDQELLIQQLKQLFPDERVMHLLKLFIGNRIYDQGLIREMTGGLVQGVPLIALFANLYLTDFDFRYQSGCGFYVRVGDDIAFVDRQGEKLALLEEEVRRNLKTRGLELNEAKIYRGPAAHAFAFLGYEYAAGRIRLEPSYIRRLEEEWRAILVYKHELPERKERLLRSRLRRRDRNYNYRFAEIVREKSQLNDSAQLRELSEKFFHIMTEFFFGAYTSRHRRLLEERLRPFAITSLYTHYKNFHYGRNN